MNNDKPQPPHAKRVLGVLALLTLILGWWKMQSFRTEAPKPNAEVKMVPSLAQPNSAATPLELPEKGSQAGQLPPHQHFLALIFSGNQRGVQLVSKRPHEGSMKPLPPADGRNGIYLRAKSREGQTICEGVLPDPFEVRAFPAQAATAAEPIPQLQDTTFMVRLPMVTNLQSVELYYIPPTAGTSEPPDRSEWQLGKFLLSE
jgi:hypothetical protein